MYLLSCSSLWAVNWWGIPHLFSQKAAGGWLQHPESVLPISLQPRLFRTTRLHLWQLDLERHRCDALLLDTLRYRTCSSEQGNDKLLLPEDADCWECDSVSGCLCAQVEPKPKTSVDAQAQPELPVPEERRWKTAARRGSTMKPFTGERWSNWQKKSIKRVDGRTLSPQSDKHGGQPSQCSSHGKPLHRPPTINGCPPADGGRITNVSVVTAKAAFTQAAAQKEETHNNGQLEYSVPFVRKKLENL